MLNLLLILLVIKSIYDLIRFYIAKNMIYYGISLIVDLQFMVIIFLMGR